MYPVSLLFDQFVTAHLCNCKKNDAGIQRSFRDEARNGTCIKVKSYGCHKTPPLSIKATVCTKETALCYTRDTRHTVQPSPSGRSVGMRHSFHIRHDFPMVNSSERVPPTGQMDHCTLMMTISGTVSAFSELHQRRKSLHQNQEQQMLGVCTLEERRVCLCYIISVADRSQHNINN